MPPEEVCPILVCVVGDGGELAEVTVTRTTLDGERFVTVEGEELPFGAVHSEADPRYIGAMGWFVAGRAVHALGAEYEPSEPVRVVSHLDLARVGSMDGVSLFTVRGAGPEPEMLYLPVRPGCEFQPYRRLADGSAEPRPEEGEPTTDDAPSRR